MTQEKMCFLIIYLLKTVLAQHNFTSQHWLNGSTDIDHHITNRTNIKIHYSPHIAGKPIFRLHYYNGSEDIGSYIPEVNSEFDEGILTSEEEGPTTSGESFIGLSRENEVNICCNQANEYLIVKQTLQNDITNYIEKVGQLNNVIRQLNATITILEQDAEMQRELYQIKLVRLRKSRCVQKKNKKRHYN